MNADHDPERTDRRTAADGRAPPADDIAQVQRQRDEYFDQLQRSRAEFVNYQKRAKAQADADRALRRRLRWPRDLLDGLDNLDRATEAARGSAASGITEGLDMVHKQLLDDPRQARRRADRRARAAVRPQPARGARPAARRRPSRGDGRRRAQQGLPHP